MAHNTGCSAYLLDQLGVTRWQAKGIDNVVLSQSLASIPWPSLAFKAPFEKSFETSFDTSAALDADESTNRLRQNLVDATDKPKPPVHHLKNELASGHEIIVEDLQPIPEYAVDIDVVPVEVVKRAMRLQLVMYFIDDVLLISHIPIAFDAVDEIEQLAIKMVSAVVQRPITEWRTAYFSWPHGLKNAQFIDREDWMLGAFEGFIDYQITQSQTPTRCILAGADLHHLLNSVDSKSFFASLPRVDIVSLPELYRIPELKRDAWGALKDWVS